MVGVSVAGALKGFNARNFRRMGQDMPRLGQQAVTEISNIRVNKDARELASIILWLASETMPSLGTVPQATWKRRTYHGRAKSPDVVALFLANVSWNAKSGNRVVRAWLGNGFIRKLLGKGDICAYPQHFRQ